MDKNKTKKTTKTKHRSHNEKAYTVELCKKYDNQYNEKKGETGTSKISQNKWKKFIHWCEQSNQYSKSGLLIRSLEEKEHRTILNFMNGVIGERKPRSISYPKCEMMMNKLIDKMTEDGTLVDPNTNLGVNILMDYLKKVSAYCKEKLPSRAWITSLINRKNNSDVRFNQTSYPGKKNIKSIIKLFKFVTAYS